MAVIIVSGGTFGIGRSITTVLAKRGHQVVAFGLDAPQMSSVAENGSAELAAELAAEGLSADVLEADVSNADDVERVVRHTLDRYGRINALVNNAAIGPLGNVIQTAEVVWNRVIDVNLKGTYLCSRTVLPHMIAQGGGSIVNVGSGAGWGKANMAAYAASKGGIHALTMAMAYDHFHEHIRVNMVIPGGGGIVTGMSVGRRLGMRPSASPAGAVSGTVAGRPAKGDDIANAVAFLVSEEAEVISGTVIDVGSFASQGGPIPNKRQ
jgi:NAD(P)-dependent dehydrogenase (short-subunit alcohol dehydrogenase family)